MKNKNKAAKKDYIKNKKSHDMSNKIQEEAIKDLRDQENN